MKTIEIKAYKFRELPENIQAELIAQQREVEDFGWLYDEARETAEKFFQLSGVESGRDSWLSFSVRNFDDNILMLTGVRLRTWLINNWGGWLYTGKYYSLWSKTEVSFEHYKEGHPVLKSRRSKCTFSKDGVLTGVYYDNDLLEPFYSFIEDYKNFSDYPAGANDAENICLEDLLQRGFDNLKSTIEDEIEALQDDDHIADSLTGLGDDYTIDGKLLNF